VRPEYLPALFNLGCLYHESGSLEQARACYLSAREAAPEYPYTFYNLGLLYYEEGDYINACRSLRRCLELKPGFTAARRSLRFVLLARTCYPNEGPEEGIGRVDKYYWIGVGSAVSVLVFTMMMGWL
jgi:tetratricopeptide (TPR) repeat protein